MPILFLFLGLFGYAYLEISLLISVGSHIGVIPLILLMIAISVVGLLVLKARSVLMVARIRQQVSGLKMPTEAVVSTILLGVAGVLLIIPGFLSDLLAILLMLPFTRKLFERIVMQFLANKIKIFSFGQRSSHQANSTTFEAEFERKADEDKWIK